MGLYLAVFSEQEEELEGVEVGGYDDFATFRMAILKQLEGGVRGSRFPTLMLHSDCEGSWSPEECSRLERELKSIRDEFASLKPLPLTGWQAEVAREFSLRPKSLGECFFDVDGEPLLDRLIQLANCAQQFGQNILFQ